MSIYGIQTDVEIFMEEMGQECPARPLEHPTPELVALRRNLIDEEYNELTLALDRARLHAETKPDIPLSPEQLADIADGVLDLIYVAIGTNLALGIDSEKLWRAIQKANMAKTTGPVREDGKRLKPEGWQPPNVAALIAQQMRAVPV